MAEFQVFSDRITTKVEIAVLHPDVVASIGVVLNGERWNLAGIEHLELAHDNFDVACWDILVLAVALIDRAHHLNDELTSELVGLCAEFCVSILIKHQLCDSISVAKVDERHRSHLAASLHPSRQGDLLADMLHTQFAACVCSIHILLCVLYFQNAKLQILC